MPQHCQDEGDAERVEVGGQAWVGVVGHGDNTVNMITPRRATTWPVIVGSPPPLASAFQARHEILDAMAGDRGVVLRQVIRVMAGSASPRSPPDWSRTATLICGCGCRANPGPRS